LIYSSTGVVFYTSALVWFSADPVLDKLDVQIRWRKQLLYSTKNTYMYQEILFFICNDSQF